MNFNSGLRGEKYVIWYDIPTIEQDVEGPVLCDLLDAGDRALEAGCHHGLFTVQMADKVGPAGRIVSLGADPGNVMAKSSRLTMESLFRSPSSWKGQGWETKTSLGIKGDIVSQGDLQDVTAVKALDPDARWIAVDFRGGVTILELNVMRAFVE